jgi:uncharacterized protein (TIGR02284 family)
MSTNVVSVLNNLVEISHDGSKGFGRAGEETHNPALKPILVSRAADCESGARELQEIVTRLGGKPDSGGTMGGALHRGWSEVKAAVTKRDDHAILADCEKGEDVAKKAYRDALDKDLPAEIRTVVERQYQGVVSNHDKIRDLRDQYAKMS